MSERGMMVVRPAHPFESKMLSHDPARGLEFCGHFGTCSHQNRAKIEHPKPGRERRFFADVCEPKDAQDLGPDTGRARL